MYAMFFLKSVFLHIICDEIMKILILRHFSLYLLLNNFSLSASTDLQFSEEVALMDTVTVLRGILART